jgi:exodeoxyribonuclease V alpha subunit
VTGEAGGRPAQRWLDLDGRPQADSLDAAVEGVLFESEDRAFAVVKVIPEGAATAGLRVAGNVAGVVPGESIRLRGKYVHHPRHGLQFEAESYEPIEPRTTAGLEKYLGSGLVKGVGRALAERLVSHLGPDTLTIAIEQPDRLREVRGIGERLAERISETLKARRQEAETTAFLRSYGLGAALSRRVIEAYGEGTRDVVARDPYRLAE